MNADQIIKKLKTYRNPKNTAGMKRFGIQGKNMLGGPNLPTLRKMAKEIGKNHETALELWDSGIHEARLLAGMIGEPEKVTEKQFEKWARDFDSWDIVDQTCSNLFDKTPFAWDKAFELAKRKKEFVKRTGFVLMATLSVHDKEASDAQFKKFLPVISREATDERNFVRKAVNWALRQIGKRSLTLNKAAVATARKIRHVDSKSARWIANDALRELTDPKILKRIKK